VVVVVEGHFNTLSNANCKDTTIKLCLLLFHHWRQLHGINESTVLHWPLL